MVDFADPSLHGFGGASFGGGYSDPNIEGIGPSTPDLHGIGGNMGGPPMGANYDGSNAVSVTADFIDPDSIPGHGAGSVMGPGLAHMGPGPAGNVSQTEGNLTGGSYNANNMGGGTPGGAPGGPAQNPGAGQMPGGTNGAVAEGGGEPLIMRLQGLSPQQQNYLLSDPQALAAFNREYDRILQSGQEGNIGIGWSNDDSYTHGQYNVNAANTGGLISQGSVYNDSGSAA
tara:strand:+ start:1250 stop:1936 length:687 start_codon:yes stop_codon:yes gene_type:complete